MCTTLFNRLNRVVEDVVEVVAIVVAIKWWYKGERVTLELELEDMIDFKLDFGLFDLNTSNSLPTIVQRSDLTTWTTIEGGSQAQQRTVAATRAR